MRPIFGDNTYLGECEIGTFLEIPFFEIIFIKKSFRNFTILNPHHNYTSTSKLPHFSQFPKQLQIQSELKG